MWKFYAADKLIVFGLINCMQNLKNESLKVWFQEGCSLSRKVNSLVNVVVFLYFLHSPLGKIPC